MHELPVRKHQIPQHLCAFAGLERGKAHWLMRTVRPLLRSYPKSLAIYLTTEGTCVFRNQELFSIPKLVGLDHVDRSLYIQVQWSKEVDRRIRKKHTNATRRYANDMFVSNKTPTICTGISICRERPFIWHKPLHKNLYMSYEHVKSTLLLGVFICQVKRIA